MKNMITISLSLILVLSTALSVLGAKPSDISKLLKALDSKDTRFSALLELEELGLDAAPAVPRLIRLLDDPDKETRAAAADTLGFIGKDATTAIPKLIELLDEGELPRVSTECFSMFSAVGVSASNALGRMGEDAVAPLNLALTDKRSSVRSNAACALQDIGPAAKVAVPTLIKLLKDRDELVRERAIWALKEINAETAKTTQAIIACLEDRNFNIRVAATSTLGAIRPITPDAINGLIRASHDNSGDVQHTAAEALGKLGDDALPAIPALIELLKSRNAYRYSHPVVHRPLAGTAARVLGELGPRSKEAMPALLDLIRDRKGTFDRYGPDDKCDNYEARGIAAIAAAKIDPQSDALVRVLEESLQEDGEIRAEVAVALALIGPKAKSMVPSLIRLAKPSRQFSGEFNCICAAVAIEPDNAAALKVMLNRFSSETVLYGDDNWDLLRTALVRAKGDTRSAIPVLVELIKDSSSDQVNAARTLAALGPEAQTVIPDLLDLMTYSWGDERREAVEVLQQIASEKSDPLLDALKSLDPVVRSNAIEVLGHFPGALPLITDALNDPSARVRLASLRSLAKLGSKAKPAIPQIRGQLQADSRTIREAAAQTLKRIEQ